jgi:hypothetical protein
MANWIYEIYASFDFTHFQGYPHDVLEKVVYKFPIFKGNNVVYSIDHWKTFKNVFRKNLGGDNLDLQLKLFFLSLEEDALDWFTSLPTNNISATIPQWKTCSCKSGGRNG